MPELQLPVYDDTPMSVSLSKKYRIKNIRKCSAVRYVFNSNKIVQGAKINYVY